MKAKVQSEGNKPKSYIVVAESGNVYKRNRTIYVKDLPIIFTLTVKIVQQYLLEIFRKSTCAR